MKTRVCFSAIHMAYPLRLPFRAPPFPPFLQPSPATPDPRGAFVLTVAPPAPEFTQPFPRSIIFILDRSGSMAGEPMHFAK